MYDMLWYLCLMIDGIYILLGWCLVGVGRSWYFLVKFEFFIVRFDFKLIECWKENGWLLDGIKIKIIC